MTRTKRTQVTFQHSFRLDAFDKPQPPGTYLVETDEELIEGLSFVAYRRVSTSLHLPAIDSGRPVHQLVHTDPQELADALERDALAGGELP